MELIITPESDPCRLLSASELGMSPCTNIAVFNIVQKGGGAVKPMLKMAYFVKAFLHKID